MISSSTLFEAFIGREAELDHLVDLRIRRARESRGAVVLVEGEAGIGKSRLIAEFERAVSKERGAFVTVRCEASSVRPYGVLLAILNDVERRSGFAGRGAISAAAEALTMAKSIVVADAIEERQRRIEAFVDAIAGAAKRLGQITLVVDDAQWIDVGSLAALQAAARLVNRTPLLIVISYREEEVQRDFARNRILTALFRDGADRVSLEPLAENKLMPPLRALLPAMTRENLRRIYELSEGKPYVAEELARSCIDGRGLTAVAPTMSLQGAVLERVALLDPASRGILGLAALLGRVVRYDDLVALSPANAAIADAIRAARDLQLVAEVEAETSPAFRFRHSLTQEILYREMPERERRAGHARIAAYLEAAGVERAEEIARHLAQAGEAGRSMTAFESVGDRASSLAAYGDAAGYFEAAADAALSAGDSVALAKNAGKYVRAIKDFGTFEALRGALDRWRGPLRAAGLTNAAFEIDSQALRIFVMYHSRETASFWEELRTAVPPGLEPKAQFFFEISSYHTLRLQHRDAEAAEALAQAEWVLRPRGPDEMIDLLIGWSSLALYWHEDYATGEELAHQQLRLAEFAGLEQRACAANTNLGVFASQRGDPREALKYMRRARATYAKLGFKRYVSKMDGIDAILSGQVGDFERTRHLVATADPDVLGDADWLVARMQLERASGSGGSEARELRDALVAAIDENLPLAEILSAEAPWMLDDKDDVRSLLHRVLIDHQETMSPEEGWLGVAEFCSDEDVAVLSAKPREVNLYSAYTNSILHLFDALIARRERRPLAARELALTALPFCENMGLWSLRALALDLAGDRAGAIEFLRSIGATAELARYEKSAGTALDPVIERVKLTQREEQVGRLAVLGLSSREIAIRLNISARTAEQHITNIYDKLDINSRAGLEAYFTP